MVLDCFITGNLPWSPRDRGRKRELHPLTTGPSHHASKDRELSVGPLQPRFYLPEWKEFLCGNKGRLTLGGPCEDK